MNRRGTPRRQLDLTGLRVPGKWRALVRADEFFLAVLAALVGVLSGAGVAGIDAVTSLLHQTLFALPPGRGLSELARVAPGRALVVPCAGGAVLGLAFAVLGKLRPGPLVDPVEANALHGGRVSLVDSVIVAAQTAWSNGVGASVGLEAGFAQLGAGIASRLGRGFRLRRGDLRVLVGCGAAAAIGAAFDAPLCGAFYGIELIIGVYSITTLPLVVIAALAGTLTVQCLAGATPPLVVSLPSTVPGGVYPMVFLLGGLAGLAGIALMRGVTAVEAGFRRTKIPAWARPAAGGVLVGLLGCISPTALSSGHSALYADINTSFPFLVVAGFLVVKALASAFSIGAGFRGGLFFASLFLGALLGKVFAGVMDVAPWVTPMPDGFYAVVGMAALATAVVGGPMTMTFLALESTSSFTVTMAVLAASMTAAMTVRRLFGYSFATWRFHLRGEAIRSAVDVGWVNTLTVGGMMRPAAFLVRRDLSLAAFRKEYPVGAARAVVVADDEGRYVGMADPADAHALAGAPAGTLAGAPAGPDGAVARILRHESHFLLPEMTVREALAAFEASEAEALAVLDGAMTRRVVGVLSERHALRRYSAALDRKRRELEGEL